MSETSKGGQERRGEESSGKDDKWTIKEPIVLSRPSALARPFAIIGVIVAAGVTALVAARRKGLSFGRRQTRD